MLFFNHTHLSDGSIIAHSHPYKPAPDGKPLHGHTDSGFVYINLLNSFLAITAVSIALASAIFLLTSVFLPKTKTLFFSKGDELQLLLRGPPSHILN
jgi:hypothetical protein